MRKLLANKKQVIIGGVLCIALLVVIIILVTLNSEETGAKDTGINIEQNKGDTDTQEAKDEINASDKGNNSSGLEVLKPDDVNPGDSSNASGSWSNESGADVQTGDTSAIDKAQQNDNYDGGDKESEKDEGILKDDITWGDIY